jgi:hypothetical protein
MWNPGGVNGGILHSPKLLPIQYGCSIEFWRTWWSCTSSHDPSNPGFWSDAQDTTSLHRAVPLQVIQHPRVLSNISSTMKHGRYHELLPMMMVTSTCKPRFHTSQVWEMVWYREVLIFLSLHGWNLQIHMISNFKLQGSMPLICITLLVWLCDFQIILNETDGCFGLFNKIRSKYYILSRLDLVEWSTTSASI